jgi:hypothetical protein
MRFDRRHELLLFENEMVTLCPLILENSSLTPLLVEYYASLSDDNFSIIVDLMQERSREYSII